MFGLRFINKLGILLSLPLSDTPVASGVILQCSKGPRFTSHVTKSPGSAPLTFLDYVFLTGIVILWLFNTHNRQGPTQEILASGPGLEAKIDP